MAAINGRRKGIPLYIEVNIEENLFDVKQTCSVTIILKSVNYFSFKI